jgi:pimeloyl-ACP methyl ester carboxylesterase
VTVDGRHISYLRRRETGDPVLLTHGFGGDKNNWLWVWYYSGVAEYAWY